MKSQIIYYIEGKDSLRYLEFSYQQYNRENVCYGIKVYDYLIGYYSDIKEEYDSKPIHIIYDSKQLMNKRLDFFASTLNLNSTKLNELYEENTLLKKELLIIRNAVLKYNITKDNMAIYDIISRLKTVKEHDILLFQKLFDLVH